MPRKSALDLVEAAVADHIHFKSSAKDLESIPPDAEACRSLIEAFRRGSAPPWLTAHLLGCIGHPDGYSVVREILLSAPGLLAESYAGPALARIAGTSALSDLLDLLATGVERATREGAGYGLMTLNTKEGIAPVIAAARRRLLPPLSAAAILDGLPTPASTVVELLSSDEERDVRVAAELVWLRLTSKPKTSLGWTVEEKMKLRSALVRVLDQRRIPMRPQKRRDLAAWAAPDDGGA